MWERYHWSQEVSLNRLVMKLTRATLLYSGKQKGLVSGLDGLGVNTAVVSAFAFCYAEVFVTLVRYWWSYDTYSYAFLIPLISLYLIWVRREALTHLLPVPNYTSGLTILFAGLSTLVVGKAGSIMIIQELSLIITLTGVVLCLLGTAFLR